MLEQDDFSRGFSFEKLYFVSALFSIQRTITLPDHIPWDQISTLREQKQGPKDQSFSCMSELIGYYVYLHASNGLRYP